MPRGLYASHPSPSGGVGLKELGTVPKSVKLFPAGDESINWPGAVFPLYRANTLMISEESLEETSPENYKYLITLDEWLKLRQNL